MLLYAIVALVSIVAGAVGYIIKPKPTKPRYRLVMTTNENAPPITTLRWRPIQMTGGDKIDARRLRRMGGVAPDDLQNLLTLKGLAK